MDLEDVKKVLHVTHSQNLQHSAAHFRVTAGALSKTIKKVESHFSTAFFDRLGRQLVVNPQGQLFARYAIDLLHEYEQLHSQFVGDRQQTCVRVCGPAILLDHWFPRCLQPSQQQNLAYQLLSAFEGDAVTLVAKGQAHLAMITGEALSEARAQGLASVPLGATRLQLMAAAVHPVFQQPSTPLTCAQVLPTHDFVCPISSPFCGIARGVGSDSWRDDQYPRRIRFRSDELASLLSVVRHGHALAYLPDFIACAHSLRLLVLEDYPFVAEETILLVYKPSQACGWLQRMVAEIAAATI